MASERAARWIAVASVEGLRINTYSRIIPVSAIFVCLALWTPVSGAETPLSQPVRIMPLGDSITMSFSDKPSYRRALWFMLQAENYFVDFVGSQTEQFGGPNPYGDFDLDHEGHGGFRTENILGAADTWAANAQPDVVLLHVGTNDANQAVDPAVSAANIGAIIDTLRGRNPNIVVLLALIIGADDDKNAVVSGLPLNDAIIALNALIPGVAVSKTTAQSPVYLVDQYGHFDRNNLTWDGIHPTVEGETVMAENWFGVLAPVLDDLGADCAIGYFHSADSNIDNRFELFEIMRIVQFYNAGGFGCEAGTEDGYAPNDPDQDCCPHDSDYSPNFTRSWVIGLSELLRAVQIFNLGGYTYCPGQGTEDGFCAGPPD